jgi:DNA polymerase III epsilon subunit-like protein
MSVISAARRLIFFDTETTGLSTTNGDKIVEIGCIEMVNGIITGEHFLETFVRPFINR